MKPKVYFYTDDEVGIPWLGPDADRDRHGDFPDPRFNWCAFPSFERTDKPNDADILVVRQRLRDMGYKIDHLPHLTGREERHVFFDLNDDYTEFWDQNCIFIRGSTTKTMVRINPNSISWPWPTEDFGRYMPTPAGGWQYDVSFQGQANDMAKVAMQSCVDAGLSCNFHVNDRFWPHICDDNERVGAELRESFLRNMQSARLSLCPVSIDGVIRYRLYEAMSMARVSVHLCDNCVMPMPDKVDWSRCALPIKEANAVMVGTYIKAWLDDHSDAEIWDMGLYARKAWIQWLWRGTWAENVDLVLREKLGL